MLPARLPAHRTHGCTGPPPPSLGWQGIIPSKAEKMARKACLMITTKLMNLHDVFEKVEPEEIVKELEPVLHRSMEHVLTEVALTHAPSVWISLSLQTREELVRHRHDTTRYSLYM